MFRKIVSNLPFSPALVGQLAFYAKRLKKEEATRKLGLVFLALSLIVQSFAVFQPPESANASSSTDMVNGGISSLNEFIQSYDSNTKHLRDTMNYTGITRSEIAAAKKVTFKVDNKLSWGFAPRFSYAQGERQHSIADSNGKVVTKAYSRPLKLWSSSKATIDGWQGSSKTMGTFYIMKSCGNLVTLKTPSPPPVVTKPTTPTPPPKCLVNPKLLADDKNCQVCPGNTTLWIDDESCVPNVVKTKTATNTSQGFIAASSVNAKPGDQISYTVSVENTGLSPISLNIEDPLEDTLEYSTIVDYGGGTLNATTKVLSWPNITLKSKDKQTRTFVVRLLDVIPSTATGLSDPTSYDCKMSNVFGIMVNINIECPTPKIVETIAEELPTTGPTENLLFAGIVLGIAVYFYARTKQVKKEIVIIRRNVSSGAI